MTTKAKFLFSAILVFGLTACSSIPKNAEPVQNFDLNRYLGTWYEVARIDFRFEKNLNNTSANYSLDKAGNVIVLNSGFNFKKNEWKKAEGKAKFRGAADVAALKVSFFGPFYAGYNVVALDSNYQYALVAGRNLDYLWILSRKKSIPEDIKREYLEKAQQIGYDTSRLLWVEHNKSKNPFLNEE